MDECAVCFRDTAHRIVPCGHVVCAECALRWSEKRSTCPCCRQPMLLDDDSPACDDVLVVRLISGSHFGITVADHPRGGVRVVATHAQALMSAHGVRPGDVITHIDRVRVEDHASAIRTLETARTASVPVVHITYTRSSSSLVNRAARWMRRVGSTRFRRPRRSVAVSRSPSSVDSS